MPPPPRILLVDDDADIREAFADVLGAEGYLTASAEHGRDALTQLESLPLPDLILLDLMMPVMNGKDFLAAIAQQPVLAEIPLVVCTAFAGLGKELNRAVLRKPIDLEELLATVRATCGPASNDETQEAAYAPSSDGDWSDEEAPTDRMMSPPGTFVAEVDRRERDPHEE